MSHVDTALSTLALAHVERAKEALALQQPDDRWMQQTRSYDIARAVRRLISGGRRDGLEREVHDELVARCGREPESGNALLVPYSTLAYHQHQSRALVAGTSNLGGYLIDAPNFSSEAQALLSLLVLGKLGAQAVDAGRGNPALPKITAPATAAWLSTETTQTTETDLSFGQTALTPHTVASYVEASRQLVLQSTPEVSGVFARNLSAVVARAIEKAAFSGSGMSGSPHGIVGMAGVGTQSGTSFSLATALAAVQGTGDALSWDSNPGFVADKATAFTLAQRAKTSGSSFVLWEGQQTLGQVAEYPAAATSGMPASTMIFGNWSHLVIATWGGLEISADPYGQSGSGLFQTGTVGVRAIVTCDIGVVWPSAFCTISGVT
jgi:HK97 family phage major capsid protein